MPFIVTNKDGIGSRFETVGFLDGTLQTNLLWGRGLVLSPLGGMPPFALKSATKGLFFPAVSERPSHHNSRHVTIAHNFIHDSTILMKPRISSFEPRDHVLNHGKFKGPWGCSRTWWWDPSLKTSRSIRCLMINCRFWLENCNHSRAMEHGNYWPSYGRC